MTNKYEKKLATPSGFRDLLPDEARKREYIIEKVREVYSRFGFEPLETPVAEFEEIIVGEKAGDFNLFYLDSNKERQSDGEKESIALRFDLTVPLARVVSQYGNALPRPFKRYQVGYSFRGERPQKGRFRQFVQFDADVVGAKSIVADTEMISMITEVMKAIGVSQFVVRVNTRTLLNSLPQYIGFAENLLREVLVILDKSEKISKDEFVLELSRLRISEQAIKKLEEFSGIAGERGGVIESLKAFFGDYQDAMPGILELETIHEGLSSLGIQTEVVFDMKIIRGLGYYTGPVFETQSTRSS
jgi:histidyl-tRNA synthetase